MCSVCGDVKACQYPCLCQSSLLYVKTTVMAFELKVNKLFVTSCLLFFLMNAAFQNAVFKRGQCS